VGTIVQSAPGNRHVQKGSEKGWFRFGGSAVLTLFEPGCVTLAPDLVEATQTGYELYAHMGDVMATRRR
jgi:phosphatidylserine decarboxylase